MVAWRIKHALRERQQLNEEIFWRISFVTGAEANVEQLGWFPILLSALNDESILESHLHFLFVFLYF